MLTPEQQERVVRVVDAVLELPADRQVEIISAICADDDDVRDEALRGVTENPALEKKLTGLSHPKPPQETADPIVLGRYYVTRKLGAGGMGEVFLAEQRTPIHRQVAIKIVRGGHDRHDVLSRFEVERQTLAGLNHHGIARVLDAGSTNAGRPYFVMEYVPGVPVTQYADENKMTLRQRLELFTKVCDAVGHAHTRGVIHRDLKPGNILAFTGDGGEPDVKVIDFGIAKVLADQSRAAGRTQATAAGMVLGTYEYMSPEQAAARPDVDTRSDVYSLGVLLYELLTGTKPFSQSTLAAAADEELRRVIREVTPPRPSASMDRLRQNPTTVGTADLVASCRSTNPGDLSRTLRKELEWIPLMAIRKEPDRRYGSVNALCEDVENYLKGNSLLAGPETRRYRVEKFVGRHRAALAVVTLVAGLLVAGVAGTAVGLVRERAARRIAEQATTREFGLKTDAIRAAYRTAVSAADTALADADGVRFWQAMRSVPADQIGWEWNYLHQLATAGIVTLDRPTTDTEPTIVTLADNRRAWSVAYEPDLVLWDLDTGKLIGRRPGSYLAGTRDRDRIATLLPGGVVGILDADTGHEIARFLPLDAEKLKWLGSSAWSSDGRYVVAGTEPGNLLICDTRSGERRKIATGGMATGYGWWRAPQSPGETLWFEVGTQSRVETVDPATGKRGPAVPPEVTFFALAHGPLPDLSSLQAFTKTSGFGSLFAFLSKTNSYAIDRAELGRIDVLPIPPSAAPVARRIMVGDRPLTSIYPTPDQRRAVVDIRGESVLTVVSLNERPVARTPGMSWGLSVSDDGRRVVSSGWGYVVCVNAYSGLPIWGVNVGVNNSWSAWSHDGRTIAVADNSEYGHPNQPPYLVLLDADTGRKMADLSNLVSLPKGAGIEGLATGPDGRLWVGGGDSSLTRIDLTSRTAMPLPAGPMPMPVHEIGVVDGVGGTLAFSNDGHRLAQLVRLSFSYLVDQPHRGLFVRDASDGHILRDLWPVVEDATAIAWMPGGRSLVAATAAGTRGAVKTVKIWLLDADTGRVFWTRLVPQCDEIERLVVTPDGARIVASQAAKEMFIFDATDGELLLRHTLPEATLAMTIGRDGALLFAPRRMAFERSDLVDANSHLAEVLIDWPPGVNRPPTMGRARAWVDAAATAVHAAYDRGDDAGDAAIPLPELQEDLLPLARAIARRQPPAVRSMRSLSIEADRAGNPTLSAKLERLIDRYKPTTQPTTLPRR